MGASGVIDGRVSEGFEAVRDEMSRFLEADPGYAFQLAVYRGAELVVDLHAGDGLDADSLMIPFSTSKSAIAFTIALLVQRGDLDLDERVAHYWPEFGAEGKQDLLVRELLSHQAGLPEATPRLTEEEYAHGEVGAARLAAQVPWWRPGSAFGYHGLTIGVLAPELVRRATGVTLREFFEREIRSVRGIDFHLGSTDELERRVVELQPPHAGSAPAGEPAFAQRPGQFGHEVFDGLVLADESEAGVAANRRARAVGMPAAYATVSARGIAALYAECVVGVTGPALLDDATVARMAQLQVAGEDLVIGGSRRYGVIFQLPSADLEFGGHRAFGHDGAGGALGYHDRGLGISLGYTVRRPIPPGGADPRVLAISRLLRELA